MQAGDMVAFDVTFERKMRIAHNAELVKTKACKSLHDKLRDCAQPLTPQKASGGHVVHFMRRPANGTPSRQVRNG